MLCKAPRFLVITFPYIVEWLITDGTPKEGTPKTHRVTGRVGPGTTHASRSYARLAVGTLFPGTMGQGIACQGTGTLLGSERLGGAWVVHR